jgi:predicted PurR-regulated permease PerM
VATAATIPVRRIALATIIAIATGSVGVALAVFRRFVLLLFLGLVFSELFQAIADPLWRRFGGRRGLWLALAVLLVLGVIGGFLALALSVLAPQAAELVASLPGIVRSLAERGERVSQWLDRGARPETAAPGVAGLLADRLGELVQGGGTVALATLTAVFETLGLFFLGVFVAATPKEHKEAFLDLLPGTMRPRGKAFVAAARAGLRQWMVAVSVSMGIMGSVVTVGLWLIGVPYFLVFGVLAGFLELVPYLGPALAFLGPAAVCLATEPGKAIPVTAFYFVAHGFEANVLTPLVVRSRAHVPPSLVVLAILVLGDLAGIVGLIVATPLVVVVLAAVKEFWLEPRTTE